MRDDSKYNFDEGAADHAQKFIETLCSFTAGRHDGEPFKLADWQRDELIRPVFGWKRQDGTRRYRKVHLEIPRKNGKTSLAAAIALYMLFGEGEKGAEVLAAAADREQANICYNIAYKMVRNSPRLFEVSESMKRAIYYEKNGSSFKAISHEANTKHGYNPSCAIIDELHAHKDRALIDALESGVGSREQPLIIKITTAGVASRQNVGFLEHEYAQQVRDGEIDDESFLPILYGADEEDDWTDPKTWEKANPNLDISVNRSFLEDEVNKAKNDPAKRDAFKRYNLNIWTNAAVSFITKFDWDACHQSDYTEEDLEGRPCYAGVDLSSTTDFTAIVLAFPDDEGDGFKTLCYFYIPEDTVDHRVIKEQLHGWKEGNYLQFTEGNAVDYSVIYHKLTAIAENFELKEVAYDPYGANRIIPDLVAEGIECVAFRQGWVSMSPAMKETKRLVLGRQLDHGGNPVLSWMNSNLHFKEDEAGNVQPHKGKSRDRIDGMVALFMAISTAIYSEKEEEGDKIQRVITL